jgi:membrane protein DedA with SNARE-associated domain
LNGQESNRIFLFLYLPISLSLGQPMNEVLQFCREIWLTLRSGGFPDLGIWSYVLLGVLAATEGPLSVLLGAAAAAGGYLRPDWVYFTAVIGNLVGDCAWYLVGWAGKPQWIMRLGRFLGMHPEHIDKLEHAIRVHAIKLILLAKLSISLMVPTLIAAGLARVPWRRWFPAVFVIEVVWTALLVWVGYHATGLIARIELGLQVAGVVVILALVSAVVWYVRRLIRREEEETELEIEAIPAPPRLSTPQPRKNQRPIQYSLEK